MQRVTGWIHNDAMNISCDKAAGMNGYQMCYWSASLWGCPSVTNGKVYQKFKLLPGTYTFIIAGSHTSTGSVEIYGVVAKGSTLPDIGNVTTQSLKYIRVDQQDLSQEIKLQFTLDEPSEICIGCVGNTYDNPLGAAQPWSEFYFNYFRFTVDELK